MKKIEALLLVHPCLGDNLQTAADTFDADSESAFDLAVGGGGPAGHLPAQGSGRLGAANFDMARALVLGFEKEEPCSAHREAG